MNTLWVSWSYSLWVYFLLIAKSKQCLGAETGDEEEYQTAVVSSMCLCLKLVIRLLSSSSFCTL